MRTYTNVVYLLSLLENHCKVLWRSRKSTTAQFQHHSLQSSAWRVLWFGKMCIRFTVILKWRKFEKHHLSFFYLMLKFLFPPDPPPPDHYAKLSLRQLAIEKPVKSPRTIIIIKIAPLGWQRSSRMSIIIYRSSGLITIRVYILVVIVHYRRH